MPARAALTARSAAQPDGTLMRLTHIGLPSNAPVMRKAWPITSAG